MPGDRLRFDAAFGGERLGVEVELDLDETTPVFVISVAAQLAGMHPQTLRQYDRIGLVSPGRTAGRGRRYSARDVAMLREVQRLSQEEGVNLAGIKRILELELENGALREQVGRLRSELDKAVVAKQRAEVKPVLVRAAEAPAVVVGGAPRVRDISYRGRNGSGDLEIAVAPNVVVTEGRVTKTRAELYLDGVELGANLERKLDVTNLGSPVRSVTTYRDPRIANRVVVVIELITASTPRVVRHAGGIRWLFQENDRG